jgi:S1-C subfamily serine protease
MNATITVINTINPALLRITVSAKGVAVSGSGFIIRNDGYAITNHHVIETAGSITVTTGDNNQYNATVTASDSNRDLALLKLDSKRTDFPVAVLGLSSDLIIGDDVVACGYPLGFNLPGPASFTRGIISAERTLNGQDFVQTDCEVDPGSSGGCLINVRGAVVGVMSDAVLPAGQQLEAIALAIPVTDVLTFIANNLK